jgi:hypothetical protein
MAAHIVKLYPARTLAAIMIYEEINSLFLREITC